MQAAEIAASKEVLVVKLVDEVMGGFAFFGSSHFFGSCSTGSYS